jgi:hypothetical protein
MLRKQKYGFKENRVFCLFNPMLMNEFREWENRWLRDKKNCYGLLQNPCLVIFVLICFALHWAFDKMPTALNPSLPAKKVSNFSQRWKRVEGIF